MAVSFIRVDDRIIHGQIVTRWARERKCDGIIAVDDKTAKNKILKSVVKNAAPPGIKAGVFTVEQALPKLKKASQVKENYFLIVKTPTTLVSLLENGCDFIKKINIGPISSKEGAENVGPNAALTKEEIQACEYFYEQGITITFKLVPNSKPYTWEDIRKKYI